jgi:hypothetical protein
MKRFDWKITAELVGIAAIVASLYFLGAQLRVSQEIAQSEVAAAHNATLVEINNSISAHADIWVRGNAGDDLSETELAIYRGLLEGMEEYHRLEWRHALRFNRGGGAQNDPAEFAVFLYDNPGARRIWSSGENAFIESMKRIDPGYSSQQFADLVIEGLKKADERQ